LFVMQKEFWIVVKTGWRNYFKPHIISKGALSG